MKTLCRFLSKYMAALVLAAAMLALATPGTFRHIPTAAITYLLGTIMFGMGLTLTLNDFKVVFSRPRDVAAGCMAQFIIMPLLAWALAKAFSLNEALTLGVILVGCCPGGTASNVMTFLARGDVALSVGMTGVSTLLAPLMTPLLTWLFAGKDIYVDAAGMLLSILKIVILPIAFGLLAKKIWPRATEKAADHLPALSTLAIITIVIIVISANAEKLLLGGPGIIMAVMLHNLCGITLGWILASLLGMPASKRRAVSIEVGMQNSGLATSLAASHFAAYPMAAVPGALFSVWHNISGALIARFYARPADGYLAG